MDLAKLLCPKEPRNTGVVARQLGQVANEYGKEKEGGYD
jgi:hypothetical protein